MPARAREQCVDEIPCRVIEGEMMRQKAGRLVGVACALAPRAKMRNEPLERGIDADERAVAPPCDRVDVRVHLPQPGRRVRCGAGTEAGKPGEAGWRERRQQRIARTIPRRHEDRYEAIAELGAKPRATATKLVDPHVDAATVAELGAALVRARMVPMRVPVLDERRFATA